VTSAEHCIRAEQLLDRVRDVLDSDDPPGEPGLFLVSVAAVAGLTRRRDAVRASSAPRHR
jgi:MYXO-CTERM domain-containing protein